MQSNVKSRTVQHNENVPKSLCFSNLVSTGVVVKKERMSVHVHEESYRYFLFFGKQIVKKMFYESSKEVTCLKFLRHRKLCCGVAGILCFGIWNIGRHSQYIFGLQTSLKDWKFIYFITHVERG